MSLGEALKIGKKFLADAFSPLLQMIRKQGIEISLQHLTLPTI
jgi:hypothetical protein